MNKIIQAVLFILILTLFVIICNPTMHKTISIADPESDIVFEHKTVIINKQDKLFNKDTIKNENNNYLSAVNNISAQNRTKIQPKNNIKSTNEKITLVNNDKYSNTFSYEKYNTISPYVQKIKEREKYGIKDTNNTRVQLNQQQNTYNHHLPKYNEYTNENESKEVAVQDQTEIISWNKWRSDLGNRIAYDSNQWANNNGLYWFVFNVTKEKQIINPKVIIIGGTSTDLTAAYNYLNSLSGSSILEFPLKTKRTKVNTTYLIYINENTPDSYLDSSDFFDYENVR